MGHLAEQGEEKDALEQITYWPLLTCSVVDGTRGSTRLHSQKLRWIANSYVTTLLSLCVN